MASPECLFGPVHGPVSFFPLFIRRIGASARSVTLARFNVRGQVPTCEQRQDRRAMTQFGTVCGLQFARVSYHKLFVSNPTRLDEARDGDLPCGPGFSTATRFLSP